jgi:diguanylate cyclase (GGDEF)-like protein
MTVSLPGMLKAVKSFIDCGPTAILSALCLGSAVLAAPTPPSAGLPANPVAQPRFESIGVGAIPRGVVATLAQDGAGFLWIATGDGLVRFDGYQFLPQERDDPDPARRNLGWIRALLPTRDGRLWIGTESQGLAVYDPVNERVSDVYTAAPAPDTSAVLAMAEDRDGGIWYGGIAGGLHRFDPRNARTSHWRRGSPSEGLPDDRIGALAVGRDGTLWVGTWRGLSRLPPRGDRFEPVPLWGPSADTHSAGSGDHEITALLEASNGRIWVGTRSGSLAVVDPGTGRGHLLPVTDPSPVTSMVEDPGTAVWVGRASGIDIVGLGDGLQLRRLRHDPLQPAGLGADEVTQLLRDRDGRIWVGGLGLGLQRTNPANRSIWVRGADPPARNALKDADVRSLLRLADGKVLVATHRGGLAVLDPALRATMARAGTGAAADSPALPEQIMSMAQSPDGSVWVGGRSALVQFDQARSPLRRVGHGAGLTYAVQPGRDGSLWFGTQDGLYRLAAGAAAPTRVALAGGKALDGDVFALALAPDGALWVGSADGLFHAPSGSTAIEPVAMAADGELGNPTVIGLLTDRQGTLWVDTAVTGLHRLVNWDGRTARFDRVSQRHGVLGRPFGGGLLQDARGRIWSHMHVYDPAKDVLYALGATDGVLFGTGWFRSCTYGSGDQLLFGGSQGLLVIEAGRFEIPTETPPLVVSALRINGERRSAGQLAHGLKIEPGQRSFGVEFAALDYGDPARLRYAYRLDGFDPDWIATDAQLRVASYSNLDPGNYVLRVRATHRGAGWSERELQVPVQVLPAWWQSNAVRVAAVLALLTLSWLAVRRHTRQLRLQQQELESKVVRRTAALEIMTRALERESAALAESSLTDPLTGMRNRRFLTQHIEVDAELAARHYADGGRAAPDDADLIFFLVDIDHFKQVNDLHGHACGDAVLHQMRGRLKQVFRDTNYLVRWGGEEFLVVARATMRRHAPGLAERARAAVGEQPFDLPDGTQLQCTCSVGFCAFPLAPDLPQGLNWGASIELADAALYAVKAAGRNGWMGLVTARAEDGAQALREWSRGPLEAWWRSGTLDLAHSAGCEVELQGPEPADPAAGR